MSGLAASPARLRPLAVVLRAVALFAILTGLLDVATGTWFLAVSGAELSGAASDPLLDSQFRFLGAMWFGFGLALWWASLDLAGRAPLLHILAGAFLLGGLGRVLSAALYGPPPALFVVFLLIECLGPVAVLLWHRRLTRRP